MMVAREPQVHQGLWHVEEAKRCLCLCAVVAEEEGQPLRKRRRLTQRGDGAAAEDEAGEEEEPELPRTDFEEVAPGALPVGRRARS